MIVTLRQADFVDLGVIHAIRRKAILGIKSARLTEGDRLNCDCLAFRTLPGQRPGIRSPTVTH
ncbi:MAG: hypothetical protein O7B27_05445 [Gammaproteobacteria bacterium]|nr:hypothetical protein [Pseudomonadota bacterium]MCZ6731980.1 hypothetical protein [Gammaproteobacteria bacterium]TDJ65070.1 MAG: hypothetical protein E2O37_05585 [Pseudomonadota bacterium]